MCCLRTSGALVCRVPEGNGLVTDEGTKSEAVKRGCRNQGPLASEELCCRHTVSHDDGRRWARKVIQSSWPGVPIKSVSYLQSKLSVYRGDPVWGNCLGCLWTGGAGGDRLGAGTAAGGGGILKNSLQVKSHAANQFHGLQTGGQWVYPLD